MKEFQPDGQQPRQEHEIEVKFNCDLGLFPEVLKLVEPIAVSSVQIKNLESTYFDTADLRLHNAGVSVRMRTDDSGKSLCGFKSVDHGANSTFGRIQIEVPMRGPQPKLDQLGPVAGPWLEGIIGQDELSPQFVVCVQRKLIVIKHVTSEIEIAMDSGIVQGKEQQVLFFELELEFKSGDERHLYDFAMLLARKFLLTLNFVTKSERGFRTMGKQPPKWVSVQSSRPIANLAFDQLLTISASRALGHFTSNWAALLEGFEPEAAHQMRIALRGFRDLTDIYNAAFPCPDFRRLQQMARNVGKSLGQERSLDVLRRHLGTFQILPRLELPELRALTAIAEDYHVRSYEAARTAIRAEATTQFVLEAQNFILQIPERYQTGQHVANDSTAPNGILAEKTLERLHKGILKRGRSLTKLSDEKLHALRLKVKAMRCATNMFPGLGRSKLKATSYAQIIGQLQKTLGAHNDNVFALVFLRSVAKTDRVDAKMCAKQLIRKIKRADKHELTKLNTIWKKFKNSETYWEPLVLV